MKKSYHSIVVPIALATATRRASARTGAAVATTEFSTSDGIGIAKHPLIPATGVGLIAAMVWLKNEGR